MRICMIIVKRLREVNDKMVFGLFKRKDPVCGMKEEKGKGIEKHDKWFCSAKCVKEYEKESKKQAKSEKSCCCCG